MAELTIDQALQQAVEAHKAGQVQEADRLYTAILKAQPKHPDANHNMGVLAVGVGKVEQALPFFKTALKANPNTAQFWLSYIDTLIKLGKLADAKAVLDQAKSKGAKGDGFDKLKQRLRRKSVKCYFWKGKDFSNIGDELTPYLIEKFTDLNVVRTNYRDSGAMFAVGSILGAATKETQTVWGSGFIQKHQTIELKSQIFAVRGPLTLRQANLRCLPVGDPALLLPRVYTPETKKKFKIGFIPHYIDRRFFLNNFVADADISYNILDITSCDIENFIDEVNECEFIISSTLHGLIIAQAYGIPALWVEFSDQVIGGGFKFFDYFLSVGIPPYTAERIDSSRCRLSIFSNLISKKNQILDIVNYDPAGLHEVLYDALESAKNAQKVGSKSLYGHEQRIREPGQEPVEVKQIASEPQPKQPNILDTFNS